MKPDAWKTEGNNNAFLLWPRDAQIPLCLSVLGSQAAPAKQLAKAEPEEMPLLGIPVLASPVGWPSGLGQSEAWMMAGEEKGQRTWSGSSSRTTVQCWGSPYCPSILCQGPIADTWCSTKNSLYNASKVDITHCFGKLLVFIKIQVLSNSTPKNMPNRNTCTSTQRNKYKNAHKHIIYKSQNMKATIKCSATSGWENKC